MRLAHELSALIDFDLEVHKVRFAGRLRDVDIVLDALKVVVEFDGAYWHRNKVDKDREKTALMEEAGWQVIRVRERPLDSIHVNEVIEVVAKLRRYEALGVDEFIYYASLGLAVPEQKRSMELFCNEVIPAFS